MKIRKLEKKDIDAMLEWMHDQKINQFFRFPAAEMTKESVEIFIKNSYTDENRHYALVDDSDEYLGTVSLKNINYEDMNAEYAISMRKCTWGTGAAALATKYILQIAFDELNLQKVYLNVLSNNERAVAFYKKIGFSYVGESKKHIKIKGRFYDLKWYEIQKETKLMDRQYAKLKFSQHGDDRGNLVVIESGKDISFDVKRVFYIYGSDETVVRGQHANRNSEFVFVNLKGKCKIKIDTGYSRNVVTLETPNEGIYIPAMVWKEMYNFSEDAILLVLSNEHYNSEEYIRDYNEFLCEVKLKDV